MSKNGVTRNFHRPNRGVTMEKIISVRFLPEDIQRVNDLIDVVNKTASEVIRDAVREYHATHRSDVDAIA